MRLEGGCLCGAVRFAIEAQESDVVDYCHCHLCRRASGAPVTAWIQVAPARFSLVQGQPRSISVTARGTRWFCGDCGSPLYMTDPDGRSVGVALGALDDASAVRPTVHGWTASRVAWFEVADGLERFEGDPPYDL